MIMRLSALKIIETNMWLLLLDYTNDNYNCIDNRFNIIIFSRVF